MLADVVTALVKADDRYDSNKEAWECTLEEHRIKQANFAIKNLRRSRKNNVGQKLADCYEIGGNFWKIDLYDTLESLPEMQQTILRKRYLYCMTLKEIAADIGMSHESVRRILGEFDE